MVEASPYDKIWGVCCVHVPSCGRCSSVCGVWCGDGKLLLVRTLQALGWTRRRHDFGQRGHGALSSPRVDPQWFAISLGPPNVTTPAFARQNLAGQGSTCWAKCWIVFVST
jgi:hypothetical protein